jgi:hypothetical protein
MDNNKAVLFRLLGENVNADDMEEEEIIDLENVPPEDLEIQHDIDEIEDSIDKPIDKEQLSGSLLFATQGLGNIKKLGEIDVFIKGPHCQQCLKDLHRLLRKDIPEKPFVRLLLGKWNTLVNEILPLLVSQKKDKKLSFFCVILLVDLTELPHPDCQNEEEMLNQLCIAKNAFLAPLIIPTLIEHLADCLQKEEDVRNERHDQFIELIIVLFKHLLQIPDSLKEKDSTGKYSNLQKRLLLAFDSANVLDSFIFLTQEFDKSLPKKLSLHFLEIFHFIYKDFAADQLVTSENNAKSELRTMMEKEKEEKCKRMLKMSSRHSRFGTTIVKKREFDGTSMLIHNIFDTTKPTNVIPEQRQKPKIRHMKNRKNIVKPLNNEIILDYIQEDIDLKKALFNFTEDFLDHSYSPLMECVYNHLYSKK